MYRGFSRFLKSFLFSCHFLKPGLVSLHIFELLQLKYHWFRQPFRPICTNVRIRQMLTPWSISQTISRSKETTPVFSGHQTEAGPVQIFWRELIKSSQEIADDRDVVGREATQWCWVSLYARKTKVHRSLGYVMTADGVLEFSWMHRLVTEMTLTVQQVPRARPLGLEGVSTAKNQTKHQEMEGKPNNSFRVLYHPDIPRHSLSVGRNSHQDHFMHAIIYILKLRSLVHTHIAMHSIHQVMQTYK